MIPYVSIKNKTKDSLFSKGREIGMVDVVGRVKSVEQTATKTVYMLDDNTGTKIQFLRKFCSV